MRCSLPLLSGCYVAYCGVWPLAKKGPLLVSVLHAHNIHLKDLNL
jgi:hypothetical protein